jgi:hypothetical protein
MDTMAERRARLAKVEEEFARLQAQYELAISAFKFDEATALQRQLAALDAEHQLLASALPPPSGAAEPPTGIVPAIGRLPRRRRTRLRR